MSVENSLKRKSEELSSVNSGEALNKLQTKISKIDSEPSQHNLKHKAIGEISENDIDIIVIDDTSIEEKKSEIGENSQQVEPTQCSISIKFHDKSMLELYKPKFLNFLNSFYELRVKCDDEFCIDVYRDEAINVDEFVVTDETETNIVKTDEKALVESVTNTSVETVTHTALKDDDEAATPSKKRKKRSRAKKELFVVDATPSPHPAQPDLRYTTKFTISTEKVVEENVAQSARLTCFNCDQLHSLKDCPQPRDYNKINAARQKFRQYPRSLRYHLEEDQKYSHLVPGRLSDELKKALGLYKNEAPPFIYSMRQLGYPPGWLEEAKFVHSNLDMFDIDGNFVKTTTTKKHKGLDLDKIVDYPGFNVPFEQGIKDDYIRYRVPPYSEDFSKQAMMKFYDEKFAKEEDNLETCDMEIDHEQESAVLLSQKELKVCEETEDRDSPSLVDLEQQKRQLLEELNVEVKEDKNTSNKEKDVLAVKASCFGTPILKSNSPYLTLPNPDNFSKDVSPVINFENLPNSTGKYEQMTDVLQKVRSTLKKIQNCNM